jgi:hypothetical protein
LNWFKRLVVDIHRRSMWQVLGIYLLGGLAAYQVVQSLTEGLGLPAYFPGLAVVLLIIFFPVVLAVAMVREEKPPAQPADDGLERSAEGGSELPPSSAAVGRRSRFSLRGAAFGVVAVLALWGILAGVWFVIGRSPAMPPTPATGSPKRSHRVWRRSPSLG